MSEIKSIFNEDEIEHIKQEVARKKQIEENAKALAEWKKVESFNELVESDVQLKNLIEKQPSVVTNTELFSTLVGQAKERYLAKQQSAKEETKEETKTGADLLKEQFLGQAGTPAEEPEPEFNFLENPMGIFNEANQKGLTEDEKIHFVINRPANGDKVSEAEKTFF